MKQSDSTAIDYVCPIKFPTKYLKTTISEKIQGKSKNSTQTEIYETEQR